MPVVREINDDTYKMAGGAGTSRTSRGSGGMITKLNAADIAMKARIDMVITNSSRPEDLYKILEGQSIGTLFKARM